MVWDISKTLNLVKEQFGAEIQDAARGSIYSADRRLRFAHDHFHEMKRIPKNSVHKKALRARRLPAHSKGCC